MCSDRAGTAEWTQPHDVDDVSEPDQFLEFGTGDDHGAIFFGRHARQKSMDFSARVYVDALRRLFNEQQLHAGAQRACKRDLLLIASAEIAGQRPRRRRANSQRLDLNLRHRTFVFARSEPERPAPPSMPGLSTTLS
jgi:hypothetical protein